MKLDVGVRVCAAPYCQWKQATRLLPHDPASTNPCIRQGQRLDERVFHLAGKPHCGLRSRLDVTLGIGGYFIVLVLSESKSAGVQFKSCTDQRHPGLPSRRSRCFRIDV